MRISPGTIVAVTRPMAVRALLAGVLLAATGAVVLDTPVSAGPVGAEPPYQRMDARTPRVTGRVTTVAPDADLQAAVDAAMPGDTLVLAAGATYRGPITLPVKQGEGWIVIRSSAADTLPAGRRVSPADAPKMARILGGDGAQPAIRTAPGAHHYALVALELAVPPGSYNLGLLRLGNGDETSLKDVPHHFVVERCYIHGDPKTGGKRGIALNAAHVAIADSYLTDWKGKGQETHAIAGWNGPGPFTIVNNHIEAAGINILFGGADPPIANMVPADIEVRRNHFTKPLAWRAEKWVAKNLFELKNARRVLVDGNVFEHSWAHAQDGFAILVSPRNQDGKSPWTVVEDVTFTNNVIRGAGSGMKISGHDETHPSQQTRRVLVRNNLFEDIDGKTWGGAGRLFAIYNGTHSVAIEHNTGFANGAVIIGDPPTHTGFLFRNNIVLNGDWGIKGSGLGSGEPTLRAVFPDARVDGNVFIGRDVPRYPGGNRAVSSVKDVGFVDPDRRDWRLAPGSRLKGAAGGRDPGADLDAIARATGLAAPRAAAAR
jgi:hypothetical protein